MSRRTVLIAPALGIFLIGSLMLLALTGFRMPSSDAKIKVAANAPAQALPALVTAPPPELIGRVAEAARSRKDVIGVAEIRSGTRWLNAWAAEGATAPTGPRPGLSVPVDAAAVDPEHFRKLVPEHLQASVGELANGGAILSRTGAALRGITSKGSLQFGGTSIPVIGVTEDVYLRRHEVVVSHATGAAIGLNDADYLLIGLDELSAGKAVEKTIRGAVPEAAFRVRGPKDSGASSGLSPLLSLGEIKAIFGEFPAVNGSRANIGIDHAWIEANTEMASIPLLGVFRCHKKVIPQIEGAIREVIDKDLAYLIRPGEFGGCFSPRYIRSGKDPGLSRHAWGIAFDFNVSNNLYGQPPTMDPQIVEIMERHGFSWGGRWNYPDGMHFEFVSPPNR